jgi:hypothetical protein
MERPIQALDIRATINARQFSWLAQRRPTRKAVTVALVLTALAMWSMHVAAAPGQDDEPDQWLPAETGTFIQINDLAQWRQSLAHDPVVGHMLSTMLPQRRRGAWIKVQQSMRMSEAQILDRYFGRRIVLVAPQPGMGQPLTLMLRVNPDDAEVMVKRLSLQPVRHDGPYKLMSTPDQSTRFAIRKHWISIAHTTHEAYLRQAMAHARKARSLADDPAYRRWIDRLPVQRTVVAFFRGADREHSGALAIVDSPQTLSIHYVGRPQGIEAILEMVGTADALQFGPLPRTTVAAVTLNLHDQQPKSTRLFDMLLAPKTYAQAIIPRIEAPLVLFVGELPSTEDAADKGNALPALGVAIKLRDVTVAEDLTAMTDVAIRLASSANRAANAQPLQPQTGIHRGITYHWADVGPMLAKRIGCESQPPVTLSYGRIGQWFVICTQADFFDRCIDADADPRQALMAEAAFARMPLRHAQAPVATVILRAPAAAAYLRAWADYLNVVAPGAQQRAFDMQITTAVKLLDGYESLTAQLYQTEDQALAGRVDLVRR